jgi:hypothetical protein
MSWKCSRPSMTVGGCTLYTLTCTGGGPAVVQGLVVLQGPGVVPVGRDHYDCCGVSRELPRCLKMDTNEEAYSFPIGNVGLVAKGYMQEKGIHYNESFSPTISQVTLRIVMVLTSMPGFSSWALDATSAFVSAVLSDDEVVYMDAIPGFPLPKGKCLILYTHRTPSSGASMGISTTSQQPILTNVSNSNLTAASHFSTSGAFRIAFQYNTVSVCIVSVFSRICVFTGCIVFMGQGERRLSMRRFWSFTV